MSKKRRTVSLEESVDDYLDQDGRNASELVNHLVKQHMNGGASTDQILEFRIQQVESEVENISGELERKESELSELKDRKEQNQSEQQEEQQQAIEKAAQALRVDELESTGVYVANDAEFVEQEADRVGCTPEELKEEAIRQYKDE